MIIAENLTRRYGEKIAVESLDLHIAAGELFCFLGPNGAGKTTTIKMLTGLLRPSSGRARIGGHDIVDEPLAAKALMGYVPDHPFLYEKLTGREFLHFVAGLYRMPDQGLDDLCSQYLDTFELTHAADSLVDSYSHGMRQKLAFAACFLHDPKVVFVDEPWVGLDPKNIHHVKTYLKDRTNEGLTVFMSTHTLSIAEEMADRVGIIHDGRLLAVGSVAEIKSLAANPGSLEDVFLELTRSATEERPRKDVG